MTGPRRTTGDSGGVLVELRPPGGWSRPAPPPASDGPPTASSSRRLAGPPAPSEPGDDRSWQDRANCLGVEPDLFFPRRGESTQEAKVICAGCAVREKCLEYALSHGEKFGIWGGTSERERRRIRRARRLAREREGQVSWP